MQEQPKNGRSEMVDERVAHWISMFLYDADVERDRTEYLSDYRNVLRDMPNATVEDWELAAAVVVHILSSDLHGNNIDLARFKEECLDPVEQLMYETEHERPKALLLIDTDIHHRIAENREDLAPYRDSNIEDVEPFLRQILRERPNALLRSLSTRKIYKAQPRLGTYVFSRIALATMMTDASPERLIGVYENLLNTISSFGRIDVGVWHQSLVREPLKELYELVGRYEDALNLSIDPKSGTVWHRSRGENGEEIAKRFIGWLRQISETSTVADSKRFLDLTYVLMRYLEGIDREEREKLIDCPKDTRQYWAWFYGYALGNLLVERPDLGQTLLHELYAGEWTEGWHAGGLLLDLQTNSWGEYRDWALKLYHNADIEHRVGPYANDYTGKNNSGDRQPPHLSAQSDLYWAMRVGFSDAHLESGQGRQASLQDIAETIDQVKSITTSSALRTVGIEAKLQLVSEDISMHLPPRDELLAEKLQSELPRIWQYLPKRTTDHLLKSMRSAYIRNLDEQCISLGRAVESLFVGLVKPAIQGQQVVLRRGTKFQVGPKSRISIGTWNQILETCGHDEVNSSVGLKLLETYPKLDLAAFGRLSTELEAISELRGYAAHDSEDSQGEKSNWAEELWKTVVGSIGYNGFLERFCIALGLLEQESVRRGKG